MTSQELLDNLAVKVYSPPLSNLRDSGAPHDLSNPLHIAVLVIDFETEVSMSGISNFLGNSSGRYLAETVEALRILGRTEDAETLREIASVADSAGMTYEAIQSDRATVEPYTVTSWEALHGEKWSKATARIRELGERLDFPQVMEALLRLVASNDSVFREALLHGRA